ncbi:hypothetical protein HOLleu_11828 [Holothuria leucospilota]|uniref:Uncharacterized protein n=1 Tax=Holothuria leucospilota TaxID=206669 RepID=A0A9Q1CAP8_HOLLE|nr:hypothetical protein HOLleu_11828 [Holothuria leucospilota]
MSDSSRLQTRRRQKNHPIMAETSADIVRVEASPPGTRRRRLLNTYIVILLVGLVVLCGSGIRALSFIPEDVVPNTRNLWNRVFNKWAWLWTLVVLTPNALLECFTKRKNRIQYLVLSFIRVVVLGTSLWAFWTKFVMPRVEYATSDFETKDGVEVPVSGTGFDISGHTFLLMMSLFIIQEELSPLILGIFYEANKSPPFIHLRKRERPCTANDTGKEAHNTLTQDVGRDSESEREASPLSNISNALYYVYVFSFTFVIAFGIFIQLLWVIMVFMTSVFFHTFLETIVGYLIAAAMWFFIYKVFQWLVMKAIVKVGNQEDDNAI